MLANTNLAVTVNTSQGGSDPVNRIFGLEKEGCELCGVTEIKRLVRKMFYPLGMQQAI